MTVARKPLELRPAQADENCIRVRLDHRTVVFIKHMGKFAYWKERYPDAFILDPVVVKREQRRRTGAAATQE